MILPTRAQQRGLLLPLLAALTIYVLDPCALSAAPRCNTPGRHLRTLTATTRQAAGGGDPGPDATARVRWRWRGRFGGEIINCDSTAVYTDDIARTRCRCRSVAVPHHLIDVAEPTEVYTAARYAEDATRAIQDILNRRRMPLVVGGTGLYYRVDARAIPDPARICRSGQGSTACRSAAASPFYRMVQRVDPASGARILARDRKRLMRALEVYFLTGHALSAHFAETTSPTNFCEVVPIGLRIPAPLTSARVTTRSTVQFERGLVGEIRALLARGVPGARPFGRLVYRQAIELLRAARDEAATRALIAQENRPSPRDGS